MTTAPGARNEVEIHRETSAGPGGDARRSVLRRFLLRLTALYAFLYSFPFPFNLIAYSDFVFDPYTELLDDLVLWTGKHLFAVEITVRQNGSGDTTWNYVQVFCLFVLALAGSLGWTLYGVWRGVRSGSREDERVWAWLRVYVRATLGLAMISYGAAKVIKSQFPAPTLDRLAQPFGDASPMGLLWTFMGSSLPYNVFTGAGEMLGGLLLVSRRTTALGALVSAAVMSNVVMLNFSYDVPVKLYSSHLLAMAAFLLLPDLRRLADLLVRNRPAAPAVLARLFRRPWLHYGAFALRAALFFGFAAFSLVGAGQTYQKYGDGSPRSPLYGIWDVDEQLRDGQPVPASDAAGWKRVVFDRKQALGIFLRNESRVRYALTLDPANKKMKLAQRLGPSVPSLLSYAQPTPDQLVLTGNFDGHRLDLRAHRAQIPPYLLTHRGFHWINEYPLNH